LKLLKEVIARYKEGKAEGNLRLDLPPCPICDFLSSVEFLVKTYGNPALRLKLEAEHKDFHNYLTNFLEHLSVERFEGAVSILRELILRIYSIDGILKEIQLSWELDKKGNFFGFLSDPYHSRGLLKIVIPKSENEKVREKLVKDFLKVLNREIELLDGTEDHRKYLFVQRCEGSVYLYIDYNALDFEEILKAFNHALSQANRLRTLYLLEETVPPYAVGELESRNFHKLDRELIEEILHLARKELLKETPQGRGNFHLKLDHRFEELLLKAMENLLLKAEVRRCLSKRSISLFYQPIVDIFTGETYGVELLARVMGKNGVPIPAGQFIDFVKEENLTIELDLTVLTTILQNLETLQRISHRLFVNLFPDSLSDKDVIELLVSLLEEMKRRDMQLVLELTEHTVVTNKEILESLERGNLTLAFDDFGSGYTNFKTVALLAHRGRASILKVDGELTKEILNSEVHQGVVRAITEFGKVLNLNLVFENIASQALLEKVRQIVKNKGLKRAYGQGFYFAPPQPAVVQRTNF
jgi:EAL domain-containing protein (putative c-di-GMP-specific phosphodiesterase class I)